MELIGLMPDDARPTRSRVERRESAHTAIERLRAFRVRPPRDLTIAADIERIERIVARTGRRLAELIEAWEALLPAELVSQSRIASYRRGVVHVHATSSAVLYELDRHLRGGTEDQLRARVRGTVVRVRLTVGPVDDPDLIG